jgi:hypothetical protein
MDLTTQLYKVIDLANRNGYPDAADWIARRMEVQKTERARGVDLEWIRRYRNEHGCTVQDAKIAHDEHYKINS